MKSNILLTTSYSIPQLNYIGRITIDDFMQWKEKLIGLNIDLKKIVIFTNSDLFSDLQFTLVMKEVEKIDIDNSLIPVSDQMTFVGLNIFENGVSVMNIYAYEFYNY